MGDSESERKRPRSGEGSGSPYSPELSSPRSMRRRADTGLRYHLPEHPEELNPIADSSHNEHIEESDSESTGSESFQHEHLYGLPDVPRGYVSATGRRLASPSSIEHSISSPAAVNSASRFDSVEDGAPRTPESHSHASLLRYIPALIQIQNILSKITDVNDRILDTILHAIEEAKQWQRKIDPSSRTRGNGSDLSAPIDQANLLAGAQYRLRDDMQYQRRQLLDIHDHMNIQPDYKKYVGFAAAWMKLIIDQVGSSPAGGTAPE